MFQAWLVKMAKTAANSAPSTRPGASDMKNTTVTEMKPRIGTDCRMSSSGTSRQLGAPALRGERRVGEGEEERQRPAPPACATSCARHIPADARDRATAACRCSSASGCSRSPLASARNARSPRIRRIASSSHRVNKRAHPPTEIGTITRMSAIPIAACRCHTTFMKIAAAMTHQRPRASRVDITSARRWSKQLRKRRYHFRSSRESGDLGACGSGFPLSLSRE